MEEGSRTSKQQQQTKETQLVILIIGQSGSGKTVLAKQIGNLLSRPCLHLNDKTTSTDVKRVDWSEATNLDTVCLVCEDIIAIDTKQKDILKVLLNFSNHHKKVINLLGKKTRVCIKKNTKKVGMYL